MRPFAPMAGRGRHRRAGPSPGAADPVDVDMDAPPPPGPPDTSTGFLGRFTHLTRLGSGTYGSVFSGFLTREAAGQIKRELDMDIQAGHYAIKRIGCKSSSLGGGGVVRPLSPDTYLEISTLAMAWHPNIVKLFGTHIDQDNTAFLILELGDVTLDSYYHSYIHHNRQQMPIRQVAEILYQVLLGVTHLHSGGCGGKEVMHCDLKPSNILLKLDQHGRSHDVHYVRICDFGMVQPTPCDPSKKPRKPKYVGTPMYCSPELLLYQKDHFWAVDIWAVGCIFGELLTGRRLFGGKGNSNDGTLSEVCRVMGKPSPSTWAGVDTLPNYEVVQTLQFGEAPERALVDVLREAVPPRQDMDDMTEAMAVDLLSKMLCLNPYERIFGAEALRHPFFKHVLKNSLLCYEHFIRTSRRELHEELHEACSAGIHLR